MTSSKSTHMSNCSTTYQPQAKSVRVWQKRESAFGGLGGVSGSRVSLVSTMDLDALRKELAANDVALGSKSTKLVAARDSTKAILDRLVSSKESSDEVLSRFCLLSPMYWSSDLHFNGEVLCSPSSPRRRYCDIQWFETEQAIAKALQKTRKRAREGRDTEDFILSHNRS